MAKIFDLPGKGNNEEKPKTDNNPKEKGKLIQFNSERFGKSSDESSEPKENLVELDKGLIGIDIKKEIENAIDMILDGPIKKLSDLIDLLKKSEKLVALKGQINNKIYMDYVKEFEGVELSNLVQMGVARSFEELKVRPAYATALLHTIFKKEKEERLNKK